MASRLSTGTRGEDEVDAAVEIDHLLQDHMTQVNDLQNRMAEAKDRQERMLEEKLQQKRMKRER